jgi:parallel beta-helix repeat protein
LGISTNVGGTVANNVVSGNGATGIFTGGTAGAVSTVVHNTVLENGGDGIAANQSSTISDNTASDNIGDGIQVVGASLVSGNTVTGNGGFGLRFFFPTTNAGYVGNLIAGNTGGTVTSGGFELGPNGCDGDTTCP